MALGFLSRALLVFVTRRDLPLLVSNDRSAAARRGIEVAHPVAGDLVAFVVAEREREAVGALELDVLACEDEVRSRRRSASRDGGGFGFDLDVDRVGGVLDGGGVRGGERRLRSNEGRDNTLEQGLGVDDWNASKRGVGGRLPVIVVEDQKLEGIVGNGEFKERAGPIFASRVCVVQERRHGDVDGLRAGVDQGYHLLARNLSLELVVNVRLVLGIDMERRFLGHDVVCDVGLSLLVLEEERPCVHK